ncbi:MAG: WYL domain-containing transcriptional regulator [Planctomycetaceae bacterium]|nr:WYL domain-containing transcriptional regulator [Planctomycetaceae bacterium]
MSDAVHFIRQWWLLRQLSASGANWTLQKLADEHSGSTKTVRRDLDALSAVGFQLRESVGPHGKKAWRINTAEILAGVSLTFDEIAALYLGRRFLEPLAGTPIWEASQRAFRKMKLGVDETALNYLDKFATAFHQATVGGSDYAGRGELIDQLMIAIEDQVITAIQYNGASDCEPQQVTIHPYGIVYHRGSLYIVAFAPHRDSLRHYKLDRIHSVTTGTEKFTRPPDFRRADHLASTFGVFHSSGEPQQVHIRFRPKVARYIQEHRWHPSQIVTEQSDGSALIELQLADLHEVKAWVLSFGAKAVVEEPEELREMILADLKSLRGAYR